MVAMALRVGRSIPGASDDDGTNDGKMLRRLCRPLNVRDDGMPDDLELAPDNVDSRSLPKMQMKDERLYTTPWLGTSRLFIGNRGVSHGKEHCAMCFIAISTEFESG